jgi:hypothetical protein
MGWLFIAWIGIYPLTSEAETQFLREAFDQKVKWKRCEERLETALWLENLGTEIESLTEKNEADCVQKSRAAYFDAVQEGMIQAPALATKLKQQKPLAEKDLSPSELQNIFPDAKDFSLLEWRIFREWFGEKNQSLQLKTTFPVSQKKDALIQPLQAQKILWILDPYRKMVSEKENIEPASFLPKNARLEIIELSPYGNADSQAEELKNILYVKAINPTTLISSGGASAIVMKTLDLNPALRMNEKIHSWINLEGKLYGAKPKKTRGLASAADAFQEKTLMSVRLQHLDSLERQPSLGKGFPIFNVIIGEKFNQEAREKILVDAETIRLKKTRDWESIFLKK